MHALLLKTSMLAVPLPLLGSTLTPHGGVFINARLIDAGLVVSLSAATPVAQAHEPANQKSASRPVTAKS